MGYLQDAGNWMAENWIVVCFVGWVLMMILKKLHRLSRHVWSLFYTLQGMIALWGILKQLAQTLSFLS